MKKLFVVCLLVSIFLRLDAQEAKGVIQSTDPDLRMEWWKKHVNMQKISKFKDFEWQFVGPTNVSGRCTDVAVVTPKGENYTMYVATATGGVWKTENEGTSWEPVFENQGPSTSIGAVAVSQSKNEIVWVGTGESNIFRSGMAGNGVYKSTNGGKTWKHMGLTGTNTIARILIHPENPNIVYVAASGHEWTTNNERGVYKTMDGGQTWEKVLFVSNKAGAIDMVMDPSNSDIIYASTWQRTRLKWNDPRNEDDYTGSGIYKSTNGGEDWIAINAGLPDAKYRGRIGIDIAASNPNVIYAFVDNYQLADSGPRDPYGLLKNVIKGSTLFRSDDGGKNWRQTSGKTPEQKNYMQYLSSTYGWVFGQITVDPNDENKVYIMGLGLNVSTDGGKTFSRMSASGGDHHGLWIDPDNSDYLVNNNDHGFHISYDGGKNWKTHKKDLNVVQFFNLNYDMDTPFRVYGSIQDHGSRRGIIDLSMGRDNIPAVDFEGAPGFEGNNHAIDPRNSNIVYAAGVYGTIHRSDLSITDRTNRQKSILPSIFPDEPKLRGQWRAPFILSPHNPDIVYHGMQYLFRSLDKGESWDKISPDLSYNNPEMSGDIPYQTLFAISESPLKYGLIYVGTDDGRVHITRNGGENWKEIMTGLPYRKWVSSMAASAFDMATVYMAQNGKRNDDFASYLWKSTDFGETWVDISGNIPCGPINVVKEDTVNRNIIYVGTDIAVYISKDSGKTWDVLGGNLPSTFVSDLVIHPRDNIIVISTHGRGIYAMDANPINNKGIGRRR